MADAVSKSLSGGDCVISRNARPVSDTRVPGDALGVPPGSPGDATSGDELGSDLEAQPLLTSPATHQPPPAAANTAVRNGPGSGRGIPPRLPRGPGLDSDDGAWSCRCSNKVWCMVAMGALAAFLVLAVSSWLPGMGDVDVDGMVADVVPSHTTTAAHPPIPSESRTWCVGCDAVYERSQSPSHRHDERFLIWMFSYGRSANRMFSMMGALAMAKLTGRTVVVPDELHFMRTSLTQAGGAVLELDVAGLAAENITVISETQFRSLVVPRLHPSFGPHDVLISKVRVTPCVPFQGCVLPHSHLTPCPACACSPLQHEFNSNKPFWYRAAGWPTRPHARSLCGHLPDKALMSNLAVVRQLKASPCRYAVLGELMHTGALTRWMRLPPVVTPAQQAALAVSPPLPAPNTSAYTPPSPTCALGGVRMSRLEPWEAFVTPEAWCQPHAPPPAQRPCLGKYVRLAPWVAAGADVFVRAAPLVPAESDRLGREMLDAIVAALRLPPQNASGLSPDRPLPRLRPRPVVALHLRGMGQYMKPSAPCSQPTGPNLVLRLRELGYLDDGGGVKPWLFIMHDHSPPSREAVKHITSVLGSDCCLRLPPAGLSAFASATDVLRQDVELMLEMCVMPRCVRHVTLPKYLTVCVCVRVCVSVSVCVCVCVCSGVAMRADAFIGNRYSSLSCVSCRCRCPCSTPTVA